MTMRLFVALSLPDALAAPLGAAMGGVAGARWQRREQLHVTLAFLGDVPEERLADLDTALSAVTAPPVALYCEGVGHFAKKGRPTTLWAAAKPADQLGALSAAVRRAARTADCPPDDTAFVPHVTLARLNAGSGPIDAFLAQAGQLATPAARVGAFELVESRLTAHGADYVPVGHYRLSPS